MDTNLFGIRLILTPSKMGGSGMSSYTVTVTDKSGNTVHSIPVASADGYVFPLTAAGAEELSAEIERAIDEHEAHLETIAKTEIAM